MIKSNTVYKSDKVYKIGREVPKWKWMGNFTELKNMSYGQIRSVKKVCTQHKGTWYGYSWSYWVEECDKILKKEELKSAYIKGIRFLSVLASAQSDTEVLYKLG